MPEDFDLLSVLQEPPQGPFAQAGSMLQGYAAGFRGQPNPAILEAQQAQRNRLAVAGILQSVERSRREKQKVFLEIGERLIQSPLPAARATGASLFVDSLQKFGPLPPGLTPESFKTILVDRPIDDQTLKAIAQDFTLFPEDSDTTVGNRRGAPAELVATLRAGWTNKTTRRLLFPHLAEMEMKEEEFKQREEDRKLQREDQAQRFKESQALRREIAEQSVEFRRQGQEIRTQGLQLQKDKAVEGELRKRRDMIQSAVILQGINAKLTRALHKMDAAGALPAEPGLFSDVAARIARHTTLKNDPDVSFFLWFGSEQGIGMARTYQKDVGVRSVQPFLAMLHGFMNPGPLGSMLPITQQWDQTLATALQAALTPSPLIGKNELEDLLEFQKKLSQLGGGIQVQGFQRIP